jgi:talin
MQRHCTTADGDESVDELGQQAAQLTQTYNCLILACKGFIQNSAASDSVTQRVKSIAQELGKSCIDLIHLTGQLQQENGTNNNNNNNNNNNGELLNQCQLVDRHAQELLTSLCTSNGRSTTATAGHGAQACSSAEHAISGILADLDTVCMFATAGTLKPDSDDGCDSFGNHREAVLRSAKTLVEDTKALVAASGAQHIEQAELARCVHTSVRTIARLADSVKLGAASLGGMSSGGDAQVLVLNAVRDVAAALRDLVTTVGQLAASVHNGNEYSASMLSEAAKSMITSVQSLLKTVKTVEDEAVRGTRALEAAIDAVYQEIKQYSVHVNGGEYKSPEVATPSPAMYVGPEDLVKATRQITLATSKAIGAGNSLRQEDAIVAANMGRKAVSDMLYVCHNVSVSGHGEARNESETMLQKRQVLTAGLNCAVFYKELLDSILNVNISFRLT